MLFLLLFSKQHANLSTKGGGPMVKNRIGTLRREIGLNQRELGQKLGVGQTTVSAWETGKNEPDSESMHRMAQLFQVSIGYLAGYEADNGHRGLSDREYQEFMRQNEEARELRQLKKEIEKEKQRECGLTDEEIEEVIQEQLVNEWQNSGQDVFLETFQIGKYFECLSAEERQRAVGIIELAFPNAVRGLYSDGVPKK